MDIPLPSIFDALKDGDVIPFLGSGASLGKDRLWTPESFGALPTASELTSHLAKKAGMKLTDKDKDLDLPLVS
jgi:hypothetical protein